MTIKEFAQKKGLSVSKAKRMAPFIKGATQCPCCKAYNIPESAKAIYIPDRRKYNRYTKLYCYVLDAIAFDMVLDENLSSITANECESVLNELFNYGLITLKAGCERNSRNHLDYMPSIQLLEWYSKNCQEKNVMICETILGCANALSSMAKAAERIAFVANQYQ